MRVQVVTCACATLRAPSRRVASKAACLEGLAAVHRSDFGTAARAFASVQPELQAHFSGAYV
jgi:hypothetical protein